MNLDHVAFLRNRAEDERNAGNAGLSIKFDACAAKIEGLCKALEPFAGVASWADRCSEKDSSLGLKDFTLHLESGAFGSGYQLRAKDIHAARTALSGTR